MSRYQLSAEEIEKETRKDLGKPEEKVNSNEKPDTLEAKPKSMADVDAELDEAAKVPEPKKKTPAEMLQNPLEILDPEDAEEPTEQAAGEGDQDKQRERPTSSEGNGDHDSSINDNDSTNGPAK